MLGLPLEPLFFTRVYFPLSTFRVISVIAKPQGANCLGVDSRFAQAAIQPHSLSQVKNRYKLKNKVGINRNKPGKL